MSEAEKWIEAICRDDPSPDEKAAKARQERNQAFLSIRDEVLNARCLNPVRILVWTAAPFDSEPCGYRWDSDSRVYWFPGRPHNPAFRRMSKSQRQTRLSPGPDLMTPPAFWMKKDAAAD